MVDLDQTSVGKLPVPGGNCTTCKNRGYAKKHRMKKSVEQISDDGTGKKNGREI